MKYALVLLAGLACGCSDTAYEYRKECREAREQFSTAQEVAQMCQDAERCSFRPADMESLLWLKGRVESCERHGRPDW